MLTNPAFWSVIFFLLPLAQALSDWHSRPVAWASLIAAVLLLSYAAVTWLLLPKGYRWTWGALRNLALDGRVALPDAARIAYEEARAHDSIWAHAAERLGVDNSPDGILDYMAGYYAQHGQLYGVRKPSTRVEAIDRRQALHGTFREGAKCFYLRDQSRTEFSDLRVSRKDVRAVRKVMRESLKTTTPI
ncbi:hypothetical protein [Burkholderia stagnalis]|uniref:hypothetical protein n=1 Tax=Burkholderia stagnalis TaxID=1503054 RepID=UPI000F5BE001|nr:hypothetical protein [Burkholderia stagnalis]RQP98903.1 hypothetical protein DF164_31365 [Burkholderia stagnalis]RQY62453.1 hypothetical protein DF110_35700 [Burkholderia stagnalis]